MLTERIEWLCISVRRMSTLAMDAGANSLGHAIAFAYPGIQIYPSCVQVEVTGEGDAFPTEFVSFPGAYTPTTPGIVYDLYSGR